MIVMAETTPFPRHRVSRETPGTEDFSPELNAHFISIH
jgi:hypothetical protein